MSGIQGHVLEVTVVRCNKLKDTQWMSKQDPYVCLEYGGTKFRTQTCKGGGRDPSFQEKFVFVLIEGLREINVVAWNRHTLSSDDFIASGKVQIHTALSHGYHDSSWTLQSNSGKYGGEIRLIMYYANFNKPNTTCPPSCGTHAPPPPPPPPQHPPLPSPYHTSAHYSHNPFSGYTPPMYPQVYHPPGAYSPY